MDGIVQKETDVNKKACGTVIPVFSLRSEDSFGIGDIGDLKKLVDWVKLTGQRIIQVLPVNDTTRTHTWNDSYPYSAISIFALHPLYISIPMLGNLKNVARKACYETIRESLNANDTVDYQAVEQHKTAYYREYFLQEKVRIVRDRNLQKFIDQNRDWLMPYSAFSYLRDKYQTADFSQWETYAHYDRKKVEQLCHPKSEAYHDILYLYFIQYTLHTQFEAVATYARANGVILKGDIPIGVNRESVEAWTEPENFNMQGQSGAPPDWFSDTGQNWSFPTYNWEVMAENGFQWWKKRFRQMNLYFDCFRIDHILGFFRIWEIPMDYIDGLCGHFRPALPLSLDEIENYGMRFDKKWTIPHIHIRFLPEIFGEALCQDRTFDPYLSPLDAEHLILNGFCSTQRQIERLFAGDNSPNAQALKNGLMRIANEILFLPYDAQTTNRSAPDSYHPRINAYRSFVYKTLAEHERQAFDRIYHNFYFNRHNDFWKESALKRLTPLVESTDMLVCGEDLGMIPASVHEVMGKLKILSLELERFSKTSDSEFSNLERLPFLSVCTTSTHDMPTVRAWWKEDRAKTQRYYNQILWREGDAPEECSAEIAEQIIARHLRASSMLTMIPLQDWLAVDDAVKRSDAEAERINVPSNPTHYWNYRMHITLEMLLQNERFNHKISRLITGS